MIILRKKGYSAFGNPLLNHICNPASPIFFLQYFFVKLFFLQKEYYQTMASFIICYSLLIKVKSINYGNI